MFVFMDGSLRNLCTASLGIIYSTQLLTSWVGNGLLAYGKVSDWHRSNPSPHPFNILTVPNWLTV